MKSELLRIEGLTKQEAYGGKLDGFRINLYRGEILGVLGLSGSGKKTLFDIIDGSLAPDSGNIIVNESPLSDGRHSIRGQIRLFRIHDHSSLVGTLTVAENIFILQNRTRRHPVWIRQKTIYAETKRLLQAAGLNIAPDTIVKTCPRRRCAL